MSAGFPLCSSVAFVIKDFDLPCATPCSPWLEIWIYSVPSVLSVVKISSYSSDSAKLIAANAATTAVSVLKINRPSDAS
jgi:hypothetical protein